MKRLKGKTVESWNPRSRRHSHSHEFVHMTEQESTGTVIEVTDENFEAEFPNIQKVIFESAFAAMDMEFTGLEVKSSHKSVTIDTVRSFFVHLPPV